jgi:aryl-alcohol dehydrogenase-like predicted oxidoreductase
LKIAIGTANLGMAYGITNKYAVREDEAIEILRFANSQGIRDFDTAPDYGIAEVLVSKANLSHDTRIQVKIPSSVGTELSDIRRSIARSLQTLNVERAHTILFHNPTLYKSDKFSYIVEQLLADRVASHIGISCYSSEEVIEAKSTCSALSAFQVPENILDRRLVNNRQILELAESGCLIQVRSIFLQGLLLLQSADLPSSLSLCRKYIDSLQQLARDNNVSVLELCVYYALQIKWADSIVFGVNSKDQVREIIDATQKISLIDWQRIDPIPEPLIDPRNWI